MRPMRPRVERRKPGEHYQKGEIKRKIITYVFNHPEGCEYEEIRDVLEHFFNIREKAVVDDHLTYFQKKGLLIAPLSNDSNLWKPISDIDTIKKLWTDEIWSNAPYIDLRTFLLTDQFQIIIKTLITPELIELNYSPTFKGNQLYENLKNVTSQEERKELESICQWACKLSPILISHFFTPNKEVLLCIISSLDEFLVIPKRGTIIPMVSNVSQSFQYVFNLLMDDWQKIRFSDKVSKEFICIFTIMTCLFFQAMKERNLSDLIFKSEKFPYLVKLYLQHCPEIKFTNSEDNVDILRMMFAVKFANELSL